MDRYRIKPDTSVDLAAIDANDKALFPGSKREGRAYLGELNRRLEALQEILYAEGKHKVLVVLQAMDTGGKDGTIRHVFEGVNPQGVKVASFKKPTPQELSHDYLWRVHARTPASGEITIFNRSHYEDVLVVRVHDLVPEARWSKRYGHIRDFEQMLVDEGTTIVKFYLHIDLEEQKERLRERLDVPEKNWKFAKGDLAERARWADYMGAYEEMLSRTSTEDAPWYVIPANRKWYRNILISEILIVRLEDLEMEYPATEDGLADIVID